MKYRKSRSLSEGKVRWIARAGKKVVARADTEEEIDALLSKEKDVTPVVKIKDGRKSTKKSNPLRRRKAKG